MNAYQTLCNMLHDGKITEIRESKPDHAWAKFCCAFFVIGFGWIQGSGESIDAAQCSALKAYRERFGDV